MHNNQHLVYYRVRVYMINKYYCYSQRDLIIPYLGPVDRVDQSCGESAVSPVGLERNFPETGTVPRSLTDVQRLNIQV